MRNGKGKFRDYTSLCKLEVFTVPYAVFTLETSCGYITAIQFRNKKMLLKLQILIRKLLE